MTRGDRLVLALCSGLFGLFLWTVAYMILVSVALRVETRIAADQQAASALPVVDPFDRLPPYWWGAWPALAFAGFGSIVGAERIGWLRGDHATFGGNRG